MEIKYYEISYDDIAQISEMESRFFSTPWSEAGIAHYAEAGNTIFVVARDYASKGPDFEYKVAGYSAIFCAFDEGNLVSIGVDEAYRGLGIARELLDISYDMALSRGVTSINLEVRPSNEAAISLYESEGFEKVGKRPCFYRNPTEDAALYIKQLAGDKDA